MEFKKKERKKKILKFIQKSKQTSIVKIMFEKDEK